jgi:hypothetical protein
MRVDSPDRRTAKETYTMKTRIAISPRRAGSLLAMAAVVALAALPTPALGASPTHVNFSESYEDVVCGIPVHVTETGQWTNIELVDKDGAYLWRGTYSRAATYTAANGKSVIALDANQLTFSDPLIDEDAGTITFVNKLRGVLEKMKSADGRVLFVDAGYATDALTLDLETGEFISFEHIVFHGRDPLYQSGFSLWCEAFTEALA